MAIGNTDGSTIALPLAERRIGVRLAEIDTPERNRTWATRAKQALSDNARLRPRVDGATRKLTARAERWEDGEDLG